MKFELLILLIIGSFTALLSTHLNKPFIGHHDFNGAFYSTIARNINRYPVSESKLGSVLGDGPMSTPFTYYTHNVPLYSWFLSMFFFLFGAGHFQARMLSLLFSACTLFLIYAIARELFPRKIAILALLFFATSAMFMYFSTNVFPEALAIPLSLSTILFFLKFISSTSLKHFYLLIASSILATLTVWGPFFLIPLLAIFYLILYRKLDPKFFVLLFIPFIIFIFFLIFLFIITGDFFAGGLIQGALSRINWAEQATNQNVKLLDFFKSEIVLSTAYYSKVTLFLSVFWGIIFSYQLLNKKTEKQNFIILILGIWGALYSLIFKNAAFIHDYFLIYFAPFFALSAAQAVYTLQQYIRRHLKMSIVSSLLFFLPLAQLFMTLPFTDALWKTGDLSVYQLGKLINKETEFLDPILILSGQFGAHFGVFTNFYADRKIIYSDFSLEDFKKYGKEYKYIVYIEGRDTQAEVNDYLKSQYTYEKFDTFYLYKID